MDSLKWVPISVIALEYNRTREGIRQWCSTGFIIELGYSVKRDETGHWIVGVPPNMFEKFSETAKRAT